MQQRLNGLGDTFSAMWHAASPPRDDDWRTYSRAEQWASERRLGAFVDLVSCEAARTRQDGAVGAEAQARLLEGFRVFACATLGWDRSLLDGLVEEFPPALEAFRLQALRFDPSLSAADVYQAARNAITMLCLQRLLGVPVGITPAIVAYSLLYPYTDNFLDDPSIGAASKAAFVTRFGERLAGARVEPGDALEQHVFGLVAMIESQYPRERAPQVFDALLAIHAAQVRSVTLFSPLGAGDVARIAIEKGGISVLADGYLVAATLTPAQAECLYGLGVFLQLRDDLEDLADDRRRKQATVFSSLPWYRLLDDPTTRTLAIGRAVVERLAAFDAPSARAIRDLMAASLLLTITDAAASAARRYRRSYRRMLERHSPFRFACLVDQRRRVSKAHGSVTSVLEAWIAKTETPARCGRTRAGAAAPPSEPTPQPGQTPPLAPFAGFPRPAGATRA